MKNNYSYYLLLLLLAPFVFLTGCEEEEEVTNDPPKFVLSTTRASLSEIKLDENIGPMIRGWAVAESGLEEVRVVARTSEGEQELLNETSFTEENSEQSGTRYEFAVQPNYTPSFSAIVISLRDRQGRSEELVLEVGATGGVSGPNINGFASEGVTANIRETVNLRPAIEGTVGSHFGLVSVRYLAEYGDTEEELEVIDDLGGETLEYGVSFVPDYNEGYQRGMTAIIIEGTDARGYTNQLRIPVTILDADPAPVVSFEQENVEADLTANPEETPEISGSVISEYGGLAEVRFYLILAGEDVEIEEEAVVFQASDLDDSALEFAFTPEYALGVSGLKVMATDDMGQVTTEVLPISVIAADPDLQAHANVTVNAQADRNDDGVVTAFSADGQTFTLASGLDADVSEGIDFITADSGGDNGLDLFSPSHGSWLPGNYFKKDASGDMTWPVLNETRMVHLEDRDGTFFNNATSVDIRNLSLGEDFKTRIEFGPDEAGNHHLTNQVILFENSRGQKGLLLFKESDNAAGKSDQFVFDIKVINE